MNNKKFYITTPIYYANDVPHIGHFATTTIADALSRYYKKTLGEENVFFTTGLDEHGTTVEKSAEKNSYKDVQKFVDEKAKFWKQVFDKTNINYDYFVRTTNKKHEKFAQVFIQKLIDAGDVYKDTYVGKYCYGCEKFLTKSDLNEQGLCPLHRADQVVETKEENYFFKLSKYAPKVKELLQSGELNLVPASKRKELLARIEAGVDDLSISRPKEKVGWSVDFPGDKNQGVYVWVEALINYLSSLEINKKQDFWPAANHTLGKDINWFHNLIWPAFLLSAGYKIPKKTFVHGFLIVKGQKISKSLGNVISPDELIEKYGIEGARYLVLANLPYSNDSDVSFDLFNENYNADLANGLGNLVGRLTKLCELAKCKVIIDLEKLDPYKHEKKVENYVSEYKLHKVCEQFSNELKAFDLSLTQTKPWEDPLANKEYLELKLNELLQVLQVYEFILPQTKQKVFKHLGIVDSGRKVEKIKHLGGLFDRV